MIKSLEQKCYTLWICSRDLRTAFVPHAKKIDDDLFELRVVGKHNIRLVYTFYKDDIYVLHGFVKKTQEIPERELEVAGRKLQQLQKI